MRCRIFYGGRSGVTGIWKQKGWKEEVVTANCYLMIRRCAFARAYRSLKLRTYNKRNLSDVTWLQAVAILRSNPSVCNELNMLTLFLLFFKLISSSDVWMAKMMRSWGCARWRSVLIKNDMKQKEKLLDEGVLLMMDLALVVKGLK